MKSISKTVTVGLNLLLCVSFMHIVQAEYSNISPHEAHTLIEETPDLFILDVRTAAEYNSGHIENATLIPVSQLDGRIGELDKNRTYLVYCKSGGRSATASNILTTFGFQDIYNLMGGITSWITEGYPIETPNQKPEVSILYPLNGSTVTNSIQIAGTAFDHEENLQLVEIRIDEEQWIRVTGTASWTYNWNIDMVSNGIHILSARSYDGEKYSLVTEISVNVNKTEKQICHVRITPPILHIQTGDRFTINITVDPHGPIASIQSNLDFNASFLEIQDVKKGKLFQDKPTYFKNGTVDNINGTLSFVYATIIGGEISSSGSFVSITFITKGETGTSSINLTEVIVEDPEGSPILVNLTNGSITISQYSRSDLNQDGYVNLLDIIPIGQTWGNTGAPGWIREDINYDGSVNILDLILIGHHWTG